MYTTYHLNSAEEINIDILESIRAAFKTRPIRIIVEEDDNYLTNEMKAILDERAGEDEATYLTGEQSLEQLVKKYEL